MSIIYVGEKRAYLEMEKCPYCGCKAVPQHHKYPDMCLECGKRYSAYMNRRSMRKKGTLPEAGYRAHYKVLMEYDKLHKAGFKVPKSLDEEIANTRYFV